MTQASSPEVQFVFDAIRDNWSLPWGSGLYGDGLYGEGLYYADDFESAPVELVDRDDSTLLDGNIRQRKGDLQRSNFVGASLADRDVQAIGTEYDHAVEAVVGIRIEGLHEDQWGHVDPNGEEGLPWDEFVGAIRRAILAERGYPDVSRTNTEYHDIRIGLEAPASAEYRDYYRHDLDVLFSGYEDLP